MDNQSSCALGALGANAEHPPSSCLVLGMKKVGIYTSSLQTVVEAAAGVAVDEMKHITHSQPFQLSLEESKPSKNVCTKNKSGASLMVQWLRIHLPMQETQA